MANFFLGNADTATALQTARTINGVSFNGTANITVTSAAGTLTGTALAAGVVSSSLTSVGTITTGVWNGTAIADTYISSAATWNAKQSALTFSTGLTNTSGTITANAVNLAASGSGGVTGTLPIANGGTGATAAAGIRANADIGIGVIDPQTGTTTGLTASNTMSVNVVEINNASSNSVRLNDIDNIKVGDTWEICQTGAGVATFATSTSVGGQVVTLQFLTGTGVKTPGQYGTMFARVRAKSGTGAAATATVLVTGGVA